MSRLIGGKRCQQGRRCLSTRPIGGATISRREQHHESGGHPAQFWVGCGAWDCRRAISAACAGAAGRAPPSSTISASMPACAGSSRVLPRALASRRLSHPGAPAAFPMRPGRTCFASSVLHRAGGADKRGAPAPRSGASKSNWNPAAVRSASPFKTTTAASLPPPKPDRPRGQARSV